MVAVVAAMCVHETPEPLAMRAEVADVFHGHGVKNSREFWREG
jgi:hypothetical protein